MAINASFKSNNQIERQISNLSYSEFIIEGRKCHSMEGFYQGVKRSGEEMQNHIFQTFGIYAKNYSKPTTFVYFNGRKIKAGTKEHHQLIFEAQKCKYTQHKESREALLSTGNSKITHNVGNDSPLYPAKVYCKHLTTIRAMLQKGEL
ncbi:hypothetical protein ACWKTZ_20815 [Bacillus cereus]